MKKRYPHKSKVLLVNITRLGDMLQATPTIAGMKSENPDLHTTVLVEKQFEEVCRFIPNIDEVVSIDLSLVIRSITHGGEGIVDAYNYLSKTVNELREKNFDYCLNMSSSAYTALLINLVGIPRSGGWNADDDGYRRIESDWAKLFATSVFHQNRQYNSLNLVDVFRCSADVEIHPNNLLISIDRASEEFVSGFIHDAQFTNSGPLIAIQAGASQTKRQWAPQKFAELIKELDRSLNARFLMTGSTKELEIINEIVKLSDVSNIAVAAGKTSIPQLAALLKASDILVTGDTGPMHVSVAVGTPVVSLFLASAYGYETGPYSEGNIVIQPIIGCGPCNPNKSCARPDCHDTIDPKLLAELVALRLKEDFKSIEDPTNKFQSVNIYRSFFDDLGFFNLELLNKSSSDPNFKFREAYRKVWLDDLGGYSFRAKESQKKNLTLQIIDSEIDGLREVLGCAEEGLGFIEELISCIKDTTSPAKLLGELSDSIAEVDREIEELGFFYTHLGPLTRMFLFGKENLVGSDPASLASQMGDVYQSLLRRGQKLMAYYN